MLWLIPLMVLEYGVGHIFEHLGHGIGGVLTVSSILWGGLKVDIGMH